MAADRDDTRIAAIVVHYGDPGATRRCLDSLAGLDEVVLVDQPPTLLGAHPAVTTRLAPGRNLGFAAACNLAVEASRSRFLLLVNNDAWLAPGTVSALREAAAGLAPREAGACLKLLGPDGLTLQSAGGLWFTRDGIGFPRAFGEEDRGQHDDLAPAAIGVPSGAAALLRREAWEEAGGMAGEFFCYGEDGDLGLRLLAAGWSFAWAPRAVVLHELSSARGPHSLFKAYHVERNHFAAMLHAAPWTMVIALPLLTALRVARTATDAALGRGAGAALAGGSSRRLLVATLLRAWAGALAMVPGALALRRGLLARHPEGAARVGAFLATHRAAWRDFARRRG